MEGEIVERFEAGNTVWVRHLEGEHEDDSKVLFEMLGHKAYRVGEVSPATEAFGCHRFHPQMLFLTDETGRPVQLFYCDVPFSGVWFTKFRPELTQDALTGEDLAKANEWLERLSKVVDELVHESEELQKVIDAMKPDGFVPGILITAQVLKDHESRVRNGQVVPGTFTEEDDRELKRIFRMNIDE